MAENKCDICGLSKWCENPIILFSVKWHPKPICANCVAVGKPGLNNLREENERLRAALRSLIGAREDLDEIIWEVLKDEYPKK